MFQIFRSLFCYLFYSCMWLSVENTPSTSRDVGYPGSWLWLQSRLCLIHLHYLQFHGKWSQWRGCMIPRSVPWYCAHCAPCAPPLGYNGHPKQCPHPPYKCFMKSVPGIYFTQLQFYIYYYYANVGKRLRLMLALMFYINAMISKLLYKV